MTDFSVTTHVLRDDIIDTLSGNPEQLAYVIAGVMNNVAADDLIDAGDLPEDVDKELIVHNLRSLAAAIENGNLS